MPSSYGSWPTPITAELVVSASVVPDSLSIHGDTVTWDEMRPDEGGRTQVVQRVGDRPAVDLLPDGFSARTAVHEYGGGGWWMQGRTLWFANWADQRLHRLTGRSMPVAYAEEPDRPRGVRWADGCVHADGRWIAVVRETHPVDGGIAEVRNEIVALDTAGSLAARTLVSGPDFVSDPRWSPDGGRLAWLEWSHPDMPWDGTLLCVASVTMGPSGPELAEPVVVAGRPHRAPGGEGTGESVFQPRWAPDGSLWFVSDRSGWWNLYRLTPAREVEPMVSMEAEIGVPQWVFGHSRYAFLAGGRVAFAYQRDGFDHLAVRESEGTIVDVDLPHALILDVEAEGDQVVCVAGSPTQETAVVRVRPGGTGSRTVPELLSSPRDLRIDPAWFSLPEPIDFPTSGGRTAHGLFYPPTNPEVTPTRDEQPPLMVVIHGGPTAWFWPTLSMSTQFWTSRGFAVVAVNYGGSTGYGRQYRDQLTGQWGVVDVDDCEAAARWLADQGRADPDRLCIRGGSAGGFTTLLALATRDTFAAGASYFGVADLESFVRDTHKFESRYVDGLVGPYPERRKEYIERSPITHVERFSRPLIVFQGMEDAVVPPSQSEVIVEALRAKGVPVAYLPFEGEQHGFRQAANNRRALEAELSFFAQVLGFVPPEDIEPVTVENLR
jgi:dipeptidyl aminopeptidase/acylaminoacyl peptidase